LRHKGHSEKVVVSIELLQLSLAVEIEDWGSGLGGVTNGLG